MIESLPDSSAPSVSYDHLDTLSDRQTSWDSVYFCPAPRFQLRMYKGNLCYFFDQEIGNEECGVFTREEVGDRGPRNRHYLAQDGTWKPWDKGYDFPADAVRIKIFAPKPTF